MPESDEKESDVVVVAKRNPKPTPEPRLVINFGEGGAWTNNFVFDYLRSLFNAETDFYIDNKFSADQKKIVIKTLSGLSNHPSFASAFEELRQKGAIINIHPATRSDQLRTDENGITVGLNDDGTVRSGSVIDIFVRIDRGGPLSPTQISIFVVHELIHALGVPAFGARLDAPDSNWDIEIWRDVFRGYDFSAISSNNGGAAPIVTGRDGEGRLAGSVGSSIYVGLISGDVFMPVGGGNAIFTRSGVNEVHLSPGGLVDRLVNGGGSTVIVVPPDLGLGSIAVLRSNDGNDLSLVIAGKPELSISNALAAGSMISVQVAGQIYPLSTFATYGSILPELSYAHIDFLAPMAESQSAAWRLRTAAVSNSIIGWRRSAAPMLRGNGQLA